MNVILDPFFKFTETTEKPVFLVGFAYNVEGKLPFKILKNDLNVVLRRSVDQFTTDTNHQNN
jgi:hypothetical protein